MGQGAVHKLCRRKGGGGGQELPILPSKKTTKRGGGSQKLPILRRHSLWTAPRQVVDNGHNLVNVVKEQPLRQVFEKKQFFLLDSRLTISKLLFEFGCLCLFPSFCLYLFVFVFLQKTIFGEQTSRILGFKPEGLDFQ